MVNSSFNGYSSPFGNPALLIGENISAGMELQRARYYQSAKHDFNAYANFHKRHAIAISGYSLGPKDMALRAIQISYAHQILKNLNLGLNLKSSYLHTNQRTHVSSPGPKFNLFDSERNYSMSIGILYSKDILIKYPIDINMSLGTLIRNIGKKQTIGSMPIITHNGQIFNTRSFSEFSPTAFSIGLNITASHQITTMSRIEVDIAYQMNKMLVPSRKKGEGNESDYIYEESAFESIFTSWTDSPEGFKGELNEMYHNSGIEGRFIYDDIFFVAGRMGHSFLDEHHHNNSFGFGIGLYGFKFEYAHQSIGNNLEVYGFAPRNYLSFGFRSRIGEWFRF